MPQSQHDYNKDELLISLIKANEPIYNMKHPSYKDSRGVKLNCWLSIAKELEQALGESFESKF